MPNINKILFITLSNMGDVILTLPVLDVLKERYPQGKITVMTGPRPKEIFEDNPNIDRLIIFDKYAKLREKIRLFNELKKEKFDLVVDLRNTIYGARLPCRYRTSPLLFIPRNIRHMKERNLYRLQRALKTREPFLFPTTKSFSFTAQDKGYIESLLKESRILANDKIILVSPGAGGETRRWDIQKFTGVSQGLSRDYKVVLIGAKAAQSPAQYICQNCQRNVYDFTGKTNLRQLLYLLKRASLLVTCDTGTLQLASYMDTPLVALFGPSDETRYGPWSSRFSVVRKEIFCRPCRAAHCRFGTVECMHLIKEEDVLRQIRDVLAASPQPPSQKYDLRRILVVRTDRIGDVLLSTPVIKALRQAYPYAYIAMMVSPYAKDIVEGNPYLDAVIVYDKDGRHKRWHRSIKFALKLKKKKFDLSLILHPTNRVHLVTFFAGIPRRIGYARKLGILLTDKIEHTKQYGKKHELEYTLDLLRYIGIEPKDKDLYIPIKVESEKWAEDLFREEGIKTDEKLLVIHPGASCPSKIWPNEGFAEVADRLAQTRGFKILIIAGPKDTAAADNVAKNMKEPAVNLAGRTSVSQLASVLKRCTLFISNDSGPVHIGSAVGTPVISIFGRNQRGLSPVRWGPVGARDKVLHKEVGCIECLAHNCKKGFACLKAITVDDVIQAAESILKTKTGPYETTRPGL